MCAHAIEDRVYGGRGRPTKRVRKFSQQEQEFLATTANTIGIVPSAGGMRKRRWTSIIAVPVRTGRRHDDRYDRRGILSESGSERMTDGREKRLWGSARRF